MREENAALRNLFILGGTIIGLVIVVIVIANYLT
jgi:hypothetical protein